MMIPLSPHLDPRHPLFLRTTTEIDGKTSSPPLTSYRLHTAGSKHRWGVPAVAASKERHSGDCDGRHKRRQVAASHWPGSPLRRRRGGQHQLHTCLVFTLLHVYRSCWHCISTNTGNQRVTPEVTTDACLLTKIMKASLYCSQIEDLMFEVPIALVILIKTMLIPFHKIPANWCQISVILFLQFSIGWWLDSVSWDNVVNLIICHASSWSG
jgi:hypothetical protein